ncbi:hypothetical protein C8Q76DRAFT_484223 [Earliella scabrosa]|nr:hypothetical protein C8Q76DRAFT_484223 [Earliella scabrosa]
MESFSPHFRLRDAHYPEPGGRAVPGRAASMCTLLLIPSLPALSQRSPPHMHTSEHVRHVAQTTMGC